MIYKYAIGDTVPLSDQLFNYATDKYVKVFLYDQNFDELPDSGIELGQIGSLGLYGSSLFEMPNNAFVIAQYVVYDDSGYTQPSTSQGGFSDTLILNNLQVGAPLPLVVQSFNYDQSTYVKASLTNVNGDAVGTPVILSPIGLLGLYGRNSTVVPNTPVVNSSYIFYDDSGYTTVSTSQGAGTDTFQIDGATSILMAGALPWVGDTLLDYFQPMVFQRVVQTVSRGFQSAQSATGYRFRGVWQPFSAQKLQMKAEGQRSWKWFTCHSDPTLSLSPDEIISYRTVNYRVMEKLDYKEYGYIEYHLVKDYTGSGPQ